MDKPWRCPICGGRLKSPVVSPCGHVFCWACVSARREPECAVCGGALSTDDLVPIYGQTGEGNEPHEANADNGPPPPAGPPPPRQQREPSRRDEEERPNGFRWRQFGLFPLGGMMMVGHFNFGGGFRGFRDFRGLVRFLLPVIVLLLLNLLFQ